MSHSETKTFPAWRLAACAAALLLIGVGCKDAPPLAPPTSSFDVTKTTCETLAEGRAGAEQAYADSLKAASDMFVEANAAFRGDLERCLADIWKGGPCDKEYEATQSAYKNAWGDISNDQFYKEWKQAKADWDACFGNYEQKQQEWVEKNKGKDKACQEEFQAKVDAARSAYDAAKAAATAKRDSDRAYLDELEKECKKPKLTGSTGTTGVIPGGAAGGAAIGGTPAGATPTGGKTTKYFPNSPLCQDAIPGENATPRTGRASDFGPKDILVNLMTTVAEDVTGTPIPIGAINDQIFAGIVCVKLHSRMMELQMEEIDAITSGNRSQEIAVRQKLARYGRAKDVWCKIAEGRPALAEVKKEAAAIGSLPTGACKTDTDCGTPICCSASQVGSATCDRTTGACVNRKTNCAEPKVCGGSPASCVNPPQKVQALNVGGKFIPLSQVHKFKGDECDDAEHWHANAGGSARASDGTMVREIHPECGFGKISDVPVVEVEMRVEFDFRIN